MKTYPKWTYGYWYDWNLTDPVVTSCRVCLTKTREVMWRFVCDGCPF